MLETLRLFFVRLFVSGGTPRLKRTVLLSSLYAYIAGLDLKGDTSRKVKHLEPMVAKFNKLLELCSDENTLLYPMYVKTAIWSELLDGKMLDTHHATYTLRDLPEVYTSMDTKDLLEAVSTICSAVPKWLRYSADDYEIKRDVARVLQAACAAHHHTSLRAA